ncbi:MAG: SLBB domain-containing protein [Acidobacteria bacterium]|nr:SLBB domain-containing protein [Acidobacteriota bacterium]
MAGIAAGPDELRETAGVRVGPHAGDWTSLSDLWIVVYRNRRLFLSIFGALIFACLIYCLLAPKEYESTGKVELRGAPDSPASERRDAAPTASIAAGQIHLETLANVLRSEQLAWDVITRLKLYSEPSFSSDFPAKFPDFNPLSPSSDARDRLLRKFRSRLIVESLPHTFVIVIHFRSRHAALSARVVNELIAAYERQETASRLRSTRGQTDWLNTRLREMKAQIALDDAKLAEFQRAHGILSLAETSGDGRAQEMSATGAITAIETLSRDLAEATADRLEREAEYRAAMTGDPEHVISGDQKVGGTGNLERALLQQLHGRRSDLELEQAKLEAEHGSNYPRMAEIRKEIENAGAQIKEMDSRLVDSFRRAWKISAHREELVRRGLDDAARDGLKVSGDALTYATMREEAAAQREVYVRLMQQTEGASLAAGSRGSAISVIDYARPSARAASPNLLLDMAIAAFVGFWLSLSAVLAKESIAKKKQQTATLILLAAIYASASHGQAPTPNTSGLPTGVARIPQSVETKSMPDAKSAPAVWNAGTELKGQRASPAVPMDMAAPTQISAGDMLDVSESHATEIHTVARVSREGTVMLPLAGEVKLEGMDEVAAGHAIEAALIAKGMLLHPQVTVLVTAYAGQDVSVLGEVVRPGVYAYTVHHRLLDLISAASGLSLNAGKVVTISHRANPENEFAVVLDPSGSGANGNHNPELLPGDTVQVGRAGLVYVVGDVIRPGGFLVDPSQAVTVVRALSLAWGPSQNASLKKAVLIREQPGGRTVTTLNLKRMLRGLDPDLPVRDRDILFVPDSMAKNLLNRSVESVIQSAAGVSIYSGLVYSQRF